jgi:hypothetical protein
MRWREREISGGSAAYSQRCCALVVAAAKFAW